MSGAAKILLTEGDAPATPASGQVVLYCKPDHKYYTKGSDGVERAVLADAGIANTTLSGTPKIFTLYDGATPYYVKAYPTKV